MTRHPSGTKWAAPPHTLAKIELVTRYLRVWAEILGKTCAKKVLTFVDGFAGPGEYTNHPHGSPIAAVRAVREAMAAVDRDKWTAAGVRLIFIERDRRRYDHLRVVLKRECLPEGLEIDCRCCSFEDGIRQVAKDFPAAFRTASPLLVFADPFGVKGAPFETIRAVMESPTSEILVSFDEDGVARVFKAGGASHEALLSQTFGSEEWRSELGAGHTHSELCIRALDLYKRALKGIVGVKYVFAFQMAPSFRRRGYHVVFASKHPTGLKKMKEAMRKVDQTGAFQFFDSSVDQLSLFRADDTQVWLFRIYDHWKGKTVSVEEFEEHLLNETPFTSYKKDILKPLKARGLVELRRNDKGRVVKIRFR